VVGLDCYAAADRTRDAKAVAARFAAVAGSAAAGGAAGDRAQPFGSLPFRCPAAALLGCGPAGGKVAARGAGRLQYGEREVELGLVEQLVEESQVRAVGDALKLLAAAAAPSLAAAPAAAPRGSVAALLAHLEAALDAKGLDALNPGGFHGAYARPRPVDVAAAMNRLRGATFRHVAPPMPPAPAAAAVAPPGPPAPGC
jgi:hypothetical protein